MNRFRRKTGAWLRALCLLAALWTAAAAETAPELMEPVGVQMDTVDAYVGTLERLELHDGYVRPYVEGLSFSREGTVGEVYAVVGQKVQKGDALVSLDQEAQQERIEALKAQIEQAQTNADFAEQLAQIDLAILEAELQALSRQASRDDQAIEMKKLDIEEWKLDMALDEQLRALEISRMQEEMRQLEQECEESVLCAPFDGVVMFRAELERGSYISAYAPVMYLADDTRLSIETECISQGILGGAVEIYALVNGETYSLTPKPVDVSEHVSKVLSGETVMTEYEIDAPHEALESGMYAAVCLCTRRVEDALLVPSNAIYRDGSGLYVYVMQDGERTRRTVKAGISTDLETQIVEGLEEGETVYVKE